MWLLKGGNNKKNDKQDKSNIIPLQQDKNRIICIVTDNMTYYISRSMIYESKLAYMSNVVGGNEKSKIDGCDIFSVIYRSTENDNIPATITEKIIYDQKKHKFIFCIDPLPMKIVIDFIRTNKLNFIYEVAKMYNKKDMINIFYGMSHLFIKFLDEYLFAFVNLVDDYENVKMILKNDEINNNQKINRKSFRRVNSMVFDSIDNKCCKLYSKDDFLDNIMYIRSIVIATKEKVDIIPLKISIITKGTTIEITKWKTMKSKRYMVEKEKDKDEEIFIEQGIEDNKLKKYNSIVLYHFELNSILQCEGGICIENKCFESTDTIKVMVSLSQQNKYCIMVINNIFMNSYFV
jgi:hypothetical protein